MRTDQESTWAGYYKANQGRAPRPLFVDGLSRFPSDAATRQAIDLGCGDGTETISLLQHGWRVIALDGEAAALDLVISKIPPTQRENIQTQVAKFEEVTLPSADLLYAGYSLPFCAPEHFDALWQQIVTSLRPGGRFAGNLFGVRDTWAENLNMTFHTLEQARQRLSDFEIEFFEEVEEDGRAVSGPKHWHLFNIIARKTA